MAQVVVNGNAYSDDGSAARDMQGGGYRTALLPMVADTMAEIDKAAQVAADFGNVGGAIAAAQEAKDAAEQVAAQFGDVEGAITAANDAKTQAQGFKQQAQDAASVAAGAAQDAAAEVLGAQDARDQAQAARGDAQTFRNTAEAAAAQAQSANAGAQTAVDAALLNGQMYATEAAGRAAVADGAYFRVLGTGSASIDLYQRTSASVSVLVKSVPSTQSVTDLRAQQNKLADFYADEAAGRAAVADGQTFWVKGSGPIAAIQYKRTSSSSSTPVSVPASASSAAQTSDLARSDEHMLQLIAHTADGVGISDLVGFDRDDIHGIERAWVTEGGQIAAQITADSVFQVAAPPGFVQSQTGLRAGLCHIVGIGQSWMGGTGGAPAITTAGRDSILMFVGGIRPKDVLAAPDCFASLAPAVEVNNAGNVRGETPMSGFARGLADAMQSEQGLTPAQAGSALLISVVAPGGQPLGGFTRGGTYWTQIVEQVQAGYERAQATGETYRLLCCPFIIGKGDYDEGQPSRKGFAGTLAALIEDLNDYMQSFIPGHPDVPLLVFQTGSHGHASRQPAVDLALNDLDREHPLVVMGGTLSAYPRAAGDVVHFSAQAYFDLGYCGGVLAHRWVFDGRKPDVMLPVEFDSQGKIISLRYRPAKLPLVLDTVGAGSPINGGFELLDASNAPLSITSVTAKNDRIVVVAASPLPAVWTLRYAVTGTYIAGQVSGPRGALRDSSEKPHWAGLFQITK